jgi:1-deoxy-D-xylulose-5-phosphate reductoisomerase
MGKRITIDSATLMNKGLEVIEARWLFDVEPGKVDIVVHPQSVVHSMVEFADGSIIAQLGATDMRQPIQYALTYPERFESCVPRMDWATASRLDFMPPDRQKFPCIGLAYRAMQMGGSAPAILNAADEIAVEAFLDGAISFPDIPRLIEAALDGCSPSPTATLEDVMAADRRSREFTRAEVTHARIKNNI